MARRRKTLGLSAEQARQALQVLIHDGKIMARDVTKAIQRREKLVRQLRARLAELGDEGYQAARRVGRQAAPHIAAANRSMGRALGVAKREGRRVLSKAQRAAYQAQGRYMAAVRALPKSARAKIKEIRESSGVVAAIKAAKKMAASR
jgi:hypothetical protein